MAQYKPKSKLFTPLSRAFFEPSAEIVAAKLPGHWVIRNTPRGACGGMIVETEAYVTGDPAAHSFRGKTKRNQAMWGPAGYSYVYFIYGNHWCFNVVCCPPGIAEAVLIRAVEPTVGLEIMRARRQVANLRDLTNGPGKLCAAMDIDRSLDDVDICNTQSPVFLAENPDVKEALKKFGPMVTTTRIGITQASALHSPFRFYLAGSEFVSRRVSRMSKQ